MMRMGRILMLTVVASTGALWFASSVRAEGGTKFAIVNLQKIIAESKKGQKAKKEYDLERGKREKAIQSLGEEIRGLQEEAQKQSVVLSQDQARQKEEEIQRKMKEAQRRYTDYQDEIARLDKKLTNDIITEVQGIVKDYAQKNGLQIVFEKSSVNPLFVSDDLDITKKVMDAYDSQGPKK